MQSCVTFRDAKDASRPLNARLWSILVVFLSRQASSFQKLQCKTCRATTAMMKCSSFRSA